MDALRNCLDRIDSADGGFWDRFYENLFMAAPDLRSHFEDVDMAWQGAVLSHALRLAAGSSDEPESVESALGFLAYRDPKHWIAEGYGDVAFQAFSCALGENGAEDADGAALRKDLAAVADAMDRGGRAVATRVTPGNHASEDSASDDDRICAWFMPVGKADQLDLYGAVRTVPLPNAIKIDYFGKDNAVAAPLQTILDVSQKNDIAHTSVCGGIGRCSTCRVVVLEGLDNCLPRNQTEMRMARLKGFSPDLRLACQTRILGPVAVRRLVHDQTDITDAAQDEGGQVGREMPLAVLFVDIRGFTPFSENNLAYDVVHALNRYFEVVGAAIEQNEGHIDKYIGDGVMALFGLKADRTVHPCVDAVNAAVTALSGLKAANAYLKDHLDHEFSFVFGIHYGTAIAGEVGFSKRRQFTAIGDVVNTASRLETEAKRQNVSILVSDAVRKALPDGRYRFGSTFEVTLKGKSGAHRAHEVLARDTT